MINRLINHFEQYIPLDREEKAVTRREIPVRTIKKNHVLLTEGEIAREFYFIFKGCIRLFYNTELEEKTAFFYLENMFVSSYESFTKQIPAKHNLQTVEETTVAIVSADSARVLLELSPKFDFLARIIMEEELIVYQEVISSFITLNAEQRYAVLLDSHPELLQRIPQHQLATYIGVTPETLSRIRKRIATKKLS